MARQTIARKFYDELVRLTAAVGFGKYADDPVGFAEEILGCAPTEKQAEVMRAVASGDRITVRSGRRVGKTDLAGMLALWFWATRRDARVILTGPKLHQVDDTIYVAIRRLYQRARVPLGGRLALKVLTGLRAEDGRQIFGTTAEHGEAFQGLAGTALFFIAEEASKVPEYVYTALQGNLAGGGKVLLIGNPTQNTGTFYESFRKGIYTPFHLSSLSSPNIAAGKEIVKGLATAEWVEECKKSWGEFSPQYRVHVLGEFVEQQEGQLFTPGMLQTAELDWAESEPSGPLVMGCDPAGDGSDGDESGFVARRGRKVLQAFTRHGLTPDAHLVELLGLIVECRQGSWQTPRIILDRDGPVGAKVYAVLVGYLETHKDAFQVVGIRGSENAKKKPNEIHHVRDELWFNLVDKFREGLTIPAHPKLQGDLGAIRFDKLTGTGKATVIQKKEIRKVLGRSPDLGDALALAAYDGPSWVEEIAPAGAFPDTGHAGAVAHESSAGGALNPYGGMNPYGGGFDPYRR